MQYSSNEFIYFDPDFNGEFGDFTDNAVFSPLQREAYLQKYATFLKKEYAISENPEYAVPLSRVSETLASFNFPETDFSYVNSLGFTVIKEKIYKTNKHIFLEREVS